MIFILNSFGKNMIFRVQDSTADKNLGKRFSIEVPVVSELYTIPTLSNKPLRLIWINDKQAKFQNSNVTYICDIKKVDI